MSGCNTRQHAPSSLELSVGGESQRLTLTERGLTEVIIAA